MTPYGPLSLSHFTPAQRAIIEEASVAAAQRIRRLGISEQGACLLYAGATVTTAAAHGRHLVLQAGTALWPRVRPEQDDGVSSTHFGYEWDPPNVTRHLMAGNMPEMHVWAGDPLTQELIDLTTGHFPAQCKALIGAAWPGDLPPAIWWGPAKDLPEGALYEPNRDATLLAHQLLRDMPR